MERVVIWKCPKVSKLLNAGLFPEWQNWISNRCCCGDEALVGRVTARDVAHHRYTVHHLDSQPSWQVWAVVAPQALFMYCHLCDTIEQSTNVYGDRLSHAHRFGEAHWPIVIRADYLPMYLSLLNIQR